MDGLEEYVRKGMQRVAESGNVFKGDDGLYHCAVCGEAKQKPYTASNGGKYLIPTDCACVRDERKQKEDYEKFKFKDDLRTKCFQGFSIYRDAKFDPEDTSTESRRALEFAANFAQCFAKDRDKDLYRGVLIFGQNGTGKTYLAAKICNAVIEQGYSARMRTIIDIASTLSTFDQRERAEALDEIKHDSLLVIDDLGAESEKEWMQQHVFTAINERYNSGRPYIITTNLTWEALTNPSDPEKSKIYDRIIGECMPIKVSGASKRRAQAESRYKAMRAREHGLL